MPVGSDTYGELQSSNLTVSGRMISAPLAYHTADDPSSETSHKSFTQVEPNTKKDDFIPDYPAHWKGGGHVAPGEIVYCLLIAQEDSARHCLILECQDETIQAYERIGISGFWTLDLFKNADVCMSWTIVWLDNG